MNRLEVNAALCNLVNGEEINESAQAVIAFASTLKPCSWSVEWTWKKGGSSFTGQTEFGPRTVKDEQEETETMAFGNKTERIGQFKMNRITRKEVRFRHFWASDATTLVGDLSEIQEYVLRFNPKSGELLYFGVRVIAKTVRLSASWRLQRFIVLPIFGQGAQRDGWLLSHERRGY